MSEKAKNVKDLEPKGRAKNVKGGVLCIPFGVARLAMKAAKDGQSKVRATVDPR